MSELPVNPSPESQTLWYYADAANQPVGPLLMDDLERLAREGVISTETHILEKDGSEWKRFASIASPTACGGTRGQPTEKDQWTSKRAIRGGVVILIFVAAVLLWCYSRPLLYLAGFLGTWVAVAWAGQRTKQSKLASIGGGFVGACGALVLAIKISEAGQNPGGESKSGSPILAPEKKKKTVSPIFKPTAEFALRDFTTLAKKLESLVDLVNFDKPMPTTVDGYANLVTTMEVRKSANYELKELTARIAEVEQAGKGGNGYAKVAEDVRFGLTQLISAVDDLEAFVNQPENRIQAARNLKEHLATMKRASGNAEARFRELSSIAGLELIKKSEYKNWLDQFREHAAKLAALWQKIDQNQTAKSDGESLLASMCKEGEVIAANYHKWIATVSEREANITDPRQMDRVNWHYELTVRLATLCSSLGSDPSDPKFRWPSDADSAFYHESRNKSIKWLTQTVEEAQRELDALPQ